MAKTTPLYIGIKEIKGIKDNTVTFKDGSKYKYTEKQLSYIISKEPLDDTKFSEMVLDIICKDVFKAIGKHEITDVVKIVGDILNLYEAHDIMNRQVDLLSKMVMEKVRLVMETLALSYVSSYNEAVGKAFGTYNKELHSDYFIENIKMSDIARLKK